MFGLDKLALIAGAITGAVMAGIVAIPIAYHIGKHDGRQAAAVEAAQAISKAYKDRNDENASVEALDSVGLCIELGGLRDDCEAGLRRMGEDQPPTGVCRLPVGK